MTPTRQQYLCYEVARLVYYAHPGHPIFSLDSPEIVETSDGVTVFADEFLRQLLSGSVSEATLAKVLQVDSLADWTGPNWKADMDYGAELKKMQADFFV